VAELPTFRLAFGFRSATGRRCGALEHYAKRQLDQTLVLETTFTTPTGVLVLTDLLALGPDNGGHWLGSNVPHLLVRRIACTSGSVQVNTSYAPRPEYGLVCRSWLM
jgi:alpha,alpha-trehalase